MTNHAAIITNLPTFPTSVEALEFIVDIPLTRLPGNGQFLVGERVESFDDVLDFAQHPLTIRFYEEPEGRPTALTALWNYALRPYPVQTVIVVSWEVETPVVGPSIHHVACGIQDRGFEALIYAFDNGQMSAPRPVDWSLVLPNLHQAS